MKGHLGVDTGGTFTDFVYWDGERWHFLKLPSTPDNPARAVLEGVNRLRNRPSLLVVHGTTVATNALLERKGAVTAFVTNAGFEDLLEIGRQNRERLYDLHYRKPEPLVSRELRFGLSCRLDEQGNEVEPLKEDELVKLVRKLKEKGVESVAVCFLHAYAEPKHERAVAERLSKEGFFVSASHELVREYREYERASTTVVNAFVAPKVASYLNYLKEHLGKHDELLVVQSDGGAVSPELAAREAVRTVLSGPAGGVAGALEVAREAGFDRIITFDMGGTSTDVSLVDGQVRVTREGKVAGFPVRVPTVEIHTVGAGGGSIARLDEGGALRVGPESAGADPGPICYGRGGKELTVTDANLFLGRLDEEYFLGGRMRLKVEPVKEALTRLARKLGLTPYEVAEGIVRVVNANMERALKRVSVERGYDPSQFTLVSFGGAGGLHAAQLAERLRIRRVLVPAHAGLLSALGMLRADALREASRTVLLTEPGAASLEPVFRELERKLLDEMAAEGFGKEEVQLERLVDARFKGQSYELTLPFSPDYPERFAELHERLYGYRHDAPVELVNLRVRARASRPKPPLPSLPKGGKSPPPGALLKQKRVFFEGSFLELPVYDRGKLLAGNELPSPCLVVEYDSTTFVPPGWSVKVDALGNLLLER
ncbi:MAG: hydantoinase/oxoprolinase family protein [Aquificae bacterium]|nr:hydantoinase/oxoprolinase family protein [Aquificota bacterium]